MEQQSSEVTVRRQFGRDRGENFSLPYGVADCAAPPVSKRRLRSGPNLHPGDMHHCADGLFARDKHLVHDSANACSLVLFLARPRAGAAGVETCMELPTTLCFYGRQVLHKTARIGADRARQCPRSSLRDSAVARQRGELRPTRRVRKHPTVLQPPARRTGSSLVRFIHATPLQTGLNCQGRGAARSLA